MTERVYLKVLSVHILSFLLLPLPLTVTPSSSSTHLGWQKVTECSFEVCLCPPVQVLTRPSASVNPPWCSREMRGIIKVILIVSPTESKNETSICVWRRAGSGVGWGGGCPWLSLIVWGIWSLESPPHHHLPPAFARLRFDLRPFQRFTSRLNDCVDAAWWWLPLLESLLESGELRMLDPPPTHLDKELHGGLCSSN